MRVLGYILIFTVAIQSLSTNAADLGQFLSRHGEGWFWYEDPPAPEPEEAPESIPSSAPDHEGGGSALLSSAWIREQLPVWQDRAMDDPNGPAMLVHVLLERLAFAKADQYQQARMGTRYSDPFLDATSGMPVSTGGVRLARAQAEEGTNQVLSTLASRAGLWFFYESSCPYCARQVIALNQVAQLHGFEVLAISIDGGALPNWHDSYVVDLGQAEQLGVARWPAIFLAAPPDSFAQVTTGLVSAPELEKRLISVGLLRGWITQEERNRTRPAQGREPQLRNVQPSPGADPTEDELVLMLKAALGHN